MKTLADALGLPSVEEEMRQRAAGGTVSDTLDQEPETLTAKEFAKRILNSREYRQSIKDRISLHALPPGLEVLLYHYAFGKPVDKLEVNDTTVSLDNVSLDSLKERVAFLLGVIDQLTPVDEDDTGVTDTATTSRSTERTIH